MECWRIFRIKYVEREYFEITLSCLALFIRNLELFNAREMGYLCKYLCIVLDLCFRAAYLSAN